MDEIEEDYVPLAFNPSSALVSGEIDPEGHIQAEKLWGVQTKVIDITTPDGMTLEKAAAAHKNGIFFEVPEEQKRFLKMVTRSTNRTNVGEEDVDGDLRKALFVGAKVLSFHSDCPKKLNLDIPGLVPRWTTDKGRTNVAVPAHSGFQVLNYGIFDPDNYFTEWMYQHNQKCSLKSLEQQVRFDIDPTGQTAAINTHSVAWKVLCDNLFNPASKIAGAMESVYAKNRSIFENPDSRYSQLAQVPAPVAREVFDSIAAPLKEIEKAYVDFNDWRPRWTPANKEAWNSTNGLVKEATVFGKDSSEAEIEAKLNTPWSVGVQLEIQYILD